MDNFNFDTFFDRRNSGCRKWNSGLIAQKFGLDSEAIPMDIADHDFEVAPAIKKAIITRASTGEYSYTFTNDQFYNAVIDWNKTYYNTQVQKEWIRLTYGTVPTLHNLVQAFTTEGEAVLINTPAYRPFAESVWTNNRKLICSTLVNNNGRYDLNFADIEQKIGKHQIKLFIFCSPQNPSGRIWTKDELYQLSEICLKHNTLLVSDEIHRDLVLGNRTFVSLWNAHPQIQNQSIICVSPNKAFNLGGLKTSYVLISNAEIKQTLEKRLVANSVTSPNVFAQTAFIAAYKEGYPWLKAMLSYVEKNFELLYAFFKKELPEVKVMPNDSSFLAWLDFSGLCKTEAELEAFFKKANIAVVQGNYFVQDSPLFARINVGCTRSLLQQALDRILKVYQEVKH